MAKNGSKASAWAFGGEPFRMKDLEAARHAQSRAAVELWNARLEILRDSGDYLTFLAHMNSPAELAGDNCTCNNACNVPCASTLMDPGGAVMGRTRT